MAEIRIYSTAGAIECAYCVSKSWRVHRYDVVASGANAEMRALWPRHEGSMRVRDADGIKHGGTSLHLDPEGRAPKKDERSEFLAERYRYGSASRAEKVEYLESLPAPTRSQRAVLRALKT